MKTVLFISFLLLKSFSLQAAIYGTDDRKDIIEVPQYVNEAKAVAIAVPNNFLSRLATNFWEVLSIEY